MSLRHIRTGEIDNSIGPVWCSYQDKTVALAHYVFFKIDGGETQDESEEKKTHASSPH